MKDNVKTASELPVTSTRYARFLGALVLGAAVGVFIGLLGMAVAMLLMGILKLGLPHISFKIAGLSATAVVFVIFFALGWISATLLIWRKLPPFSPEDR